MRGIELIQAKLQRHIGRLFLVRYTGLLGLGLRLRGFFPFFGSSVPFFSSELADMASSSRLNHSMALRAAP